MIRVDDFHKVYGDTVAVASLSFQVERGQILGLVGPNGAGKTTTLRALSGIIPPTRGRLMVAGFDVEADAVETKRRIAYVPDDPQLFFDLTVEEHLAFVAGAYEINDAEQRGLELVERFELLNKLRTPVRDLSRGMRQKVAICCAYLSKPDVVLFDEPLTGLDPQGIRTLKQSMLDLSRDGVSIIISSHLLAMVEDICSHVLILQHGTQRFFGTVAQLKEQFAAGQHDARLEDIFFAATGQVLAAAD